MSDKNTHNNSDLLCPHCGHEGPHNIHTNKTNDNPRYNCKACGRSFRRTTALNAVDAKPIGKGSIFVITCAVSGTLAHAGFLASLKVYCKRRKAKLIVVPIKYRNPTSKWENPDKRYDKKLFPYMLSQRTAILKNLILMADVPTQPTATRPLSGLQTLGGEASTIFGHPKMALESVATRVGKHAKLVTTTGAVTRSVYSKSNVGKKGNEHHVLGALVVEIESTDRFHVRHINANSDGAFYDLGVKYTPIGAAASPSINVLTCGDLHAVRADPRVLEATFFGPDSMVKVLKPKRVVLHDVLDFQSASHHNSFFVQFQLAHQKKNNVADEVTKTLVLLDRIAELAPHVDVISSNHDDHLTKWLLNPLHGHDPINAIFYHKTKAAYLEAIVAGLSFAPLVFWADQLMRNRGKVRFLTRNDSLVVDGVELAQHGDLGPNGVKGAIASFTKIGAKATIAHSHSPGIMDGVFQVGTSSVLDMEYNKGFSSWMHTHCGQYTNGKRTLLTVIGNSWRLTA